MEFNIKKLEWTRKPETYEVKDGQIVIVTEPGTDLWQSIGFAMKEPENVWGFTIGKRWRMQRDTQKALLCVL